jgi:hypothetical protein
MTASAHDRNFDNSMTHEFQSLHLRSVSAFIFAREAIFFLGLVRVNFT